MDEPFSSLDYLARIRMREALSGFLDDEPKSVVLVTHDVEEAAQLADRILILGGRPTTIQAEVRVDIPRPRDPTHPEVVASVRRTLQELGRGA